MIMTEKEDFLLFESDEEFADFCVSHAAVRRWDDGSLYYEGVYTKAYLDAVEKDFSFVIKDRNSWITKHECVMKRVPVVVEAEGVLGTGREEVTVEMKVENLTRYWDYQHFFEPFL